MKLKNYFYGMLACAAFAACSSDNAPEVMGEEPVESGEQQYMAIRVATPDDGVATKATRDFEVGEDAERKVNSVRIYLFKSDGSAYTLTNLAPGTTSNYVEHLFVNEQIQNTGNVSDYTEGVIVFQGKNNEKPARMVALVNLTDQQKNGLGTKAKSLADVEQLVDNYSGHEEADGFVMSTSVYQKGSDVVNTTAIAPENIQPSETAAKEHPVKIYVERVLAKVTMKPKEENNWTYDTDAANSGTVNIPTNNDYVEVGNADIQAVVKGCGLASTINKTYLLKSLNGISTAPYDNWNDADNFRSSWAIIPSANVGYENNSTWSTMVPGSGTMITSNYCMENTVDNNRTKLVVAAQLQKQDGTVVCVFRFMGTYYMGNENAPLTAILVASGIGNTYYKDNQGTPLAITDLELKTQKQLEQAGGTSTTATSTNSLKSYQVAAQLNNGVTTIYQKGTVEGTYEEVTDGISTINTALLKYPAEVAKNGMVYYFTDIKHYADAIGTNNKYAVIRNHLYNVKITGIKGFGTPIFNPEEPIVPERPIDTESYIAAEINVLSWKTVDQDVELN